MRELDKVGTTITTTTKPPQFSEMFQKLAMAVKTKTYEFFAEDDIDATDSDVDGFALLDSNEDFITDQKVVVIKPDRVLTSGSPIDSRSTEVELQTPPTKELKPIQLRKFDAQVAQSLVSSVFATISAFEASYLQLQDAHAPFVEENVKSADGALVSHLQRVSDLKRFYWDYRRNPNFGDDLPVRSCFEARVEENQSKLRALETISNRLQAEIDQKGNQVSILRKKLSEVQKTNSRHSKKLLGNVDSINVLRSIKVFDSILHDTCRSIHKFSKILIGLMKKSGWELNLVANSIHQDIDYLKKSHIRYAFMSYVCLGMFKDFGLAEFGLKDNVDDSEVSSLKKLLDHVPSNPLETLSTQPNCEFSRFCDKKYQELIHPTMESSIFSSSDEDEIVLNSWRSVRAFYESFVNMASAVYTLHKLASSFDPKVKIFQVERGVDFSMVYMEDVTRKQSFSSIGKANVGFTVIPGFRIGSIVIQSRVYLSKRKE